MLRLTTVLGPNPEAGYRINYECDRDCQSRARQPCRSTRVATGRVLWRRHAREDRDVDLPIVGRLLVRRPVACLWDPARRRDGLAPPRRALAWHSIYRVPDLPADLLERHHGARGCRGP